MTQNSLNKIGMSLGNVLTLFITLVSIAAAAGAANARIDEAFQRIEATEQQINPALVQIREDLEEIKVQLAKTSNDIEWMMKRDKE